MNDDQESSLSDNAVWAAQNGKHGYNVVTEFIVLGSSIDQVAGLEDALISLAETFGFIYEGGFTSQMKPEDVLIDSPLDRQMNELRKAVEPD